MALTPRQTALRMAKAARESKADGLTILDLRRLSSTFEFFVICSATSQRRSQAIADAITASLETAGRRLWHREGYHEGGWVLLDYGRVVAHIFTGELRAFYQLERLWGDAPRVTPPSLRPPRARAPALDPSR